MASRGDARGWETPRGQQYRGPDPAARESGQMNLDASPKPRPAVEHGDDPKKTRGGGRDKTRSADAVQRPAPIGRVGGLSSAFSSVRSISGRHVLCSQNRAPRTPRAMTTRSRLAVLRRRRAQQRSEKRRDSIVCREYALCISTRAHASPDRRRERSGFPMISDRSCWAPQSRRASEIRAAQAGCASSGRGRRGKRCAELREIRKERKQKTPVRGVGGSQAVSRPTLDARVAGATRSLLLLVVDVRRCPEDQSPSARREDPEPRDGPRGRLTGRDRAASGG